MDSENTAWLVAVAAFGLLIGALAFIWWVTYWLPRKNRSKKSNIGTSYQLRPGELPGAAIFTGGLRGDGWGISIRDSDDAVRQGGKYVVSFNDIQESGNESGTGYRHHHLYFLETGEGTRRVMVFLGLSASGYLEGIYTLQPAHSGNKVQFTRVELGGGFKLIMPLRIIAVNGLRRLELAATTRIGDDHGAKGWIIRLPGFSEEQSVAGLVDCGEVLSKDIRVDSASDCLIAYQMNNATLLNDNGTLSEFRGTVAVQRLGTTNFFSILQKGDKGYLLVVAKLLPVIGKYVHYAECEYWFATMVMPGYRTEDTSVGLPQICTDGESRIVVLAPDDRTILFVPGTVRFIDGEVFVNLPGNNLRLIWTPHQEFIEIEGVKVYCWEEGSTRCSEGLLEYKRPDHGWISHSSYGKDGKYYGHLFGWTPLRAGSLEQA